jgi:hypothetical protein
MIAVPGGKLSARSQLMESQDGSEVDLNEEEITTAEAISNAAALTKDQKGLNGCPKGN